MWRSAPLKPPSATEIGSLCLTGVAAKALVSLGHKPLLFRGSIVVKDRKRALRHLVACSQELTDTGSDGKLLLVGDDDTFVWSSLVSHYGLPAIPEWGSWMLEELRS